MSEHKPDTRQARRAARRKAEILKAAAKVFAEKGFHRTTVRDIAEAADIADGTVYNYFENKDDLLINLIEDISDLETRREMYTQSLDADARQSFHDLLAQRFTIVNDRNALLMAILPEIIVSPYLRELYQQRVMIPAFRDLENYFQARIDRGQVKSNADVSLVIRLLAAVGMGLEILTLIGDPEIEALWNNPERLVDLLMRVTFDGMLSVPDQPTGSENEPIRDE